MRKRMLGLTMCLAAGSIVCQAIVARQHIGESLVVGALLAGPSLLAMAPGPISSVFGWGSASTSARTSRRAWDCWSRHLNFADFPALVSSSSSPLRLGAVVCSHMDIRGQFRARRSPLAVPFRDCSHGNHPIAAGQLSTKGRAGQRPRGSVHGSRRRSGTGLCRWRRCLPGRVAVVTRLCATLSNPWERDVP